MFAYHTEEPKSVDDIKHHTFRGSRSILLLNNLDKKQVNETGWKNFLIKNKNVSRVFFFFFFFAGYFCEDKNRRERINKNELNNKNSL